MTTLVCLVGDSGSGKTATAEVLAEEGFHIVESYVTRKRRHEDEGGHIFIETPMSDHLQNEGDWRLSQIGCDNNPILVFEQMVATDIGNILVPDPVVAHFDKYNSDEHYFATEGQIVEDEVNIYVVDPDGGQQAKRFFADNNCVNVVVIYLSADQDVRIERMLERGDPYHKVKERVRKDGDVFRVVPCDYMINSNNKLQRVVSDVKDIIKDNVE